MCSRDPQTLNLRHWCLLSPKYSSSKQSTKVVARRIIFFRCRAGKSPLLCRIDSNLVTLLLLRPVCLYWSFIIIIKATGKQINLLLFHCCVWWLLFLLFSLFLGFAIYFAATQYFLLSCVCTSPNHDESQERAAAVKKGKITNNNCVAQQDNIIIQLERRRHNGERQQVQQYW